MFALDCLRKSWRRLPRHRPSPWSHSGDMMEESSPYRSAHSSSQSSSQSSAQSSAQSSTPGSASAPQMRFGKIDDLGSRVAVAVDAARKYLFSQQHEEGYWCGELEADTSLEFDYILLHTLLRTGRQGSFDKAACYILNHQNQDGGWSIYAGGPSNITASVKGYFGLNVAGFTPGHP